MTDLLENQADILLFHSSCALCGLITRALAAYPLSGGGVDMTL